MRDEDEIAAGTLGSSFGSKYMARLFYWFSFVADSISRSRFGH
jgi:hypothetical protein